MVAVRKVMKTYTFPVTSKNRPYDLILLDLDMPILNGFDACRKIINLERPEFDTQHERNFT